MHILLIHQYFLEKDDPGGARFNEMTKIWAESGVQVTVLCGMLNYVTGKVPEKYEGLRFHESYYEPNLKVIRCFVSRNYNSNFLGRLWAYFSFVLFSIWAGLFKAKGKFDLLLVTSPPLFVAITGLIVSKIKKIPYVFEVRDLWPESAVETGVITNSLLIKFSYWFERLIYRKAILINVLTPAFKKALVEKKGIAESKIIFIPNAADFTISDDLLDSFDALQFRQRLGLSDKFVVTYIGAHGVANHLTQLVEAAELLQETKVVFLLVGDGMQKTHLISEVKKRGLNNIRFLDPVPKKEVFKYILASDMGASVLKKTDTFKTIYSNKTFDYMACKKPVLLAIDGISRELIEEANCGIFVEPENPISIAAGVRSYLNGQSLAQEQGTNGYNFAKLHFDRNILAQEYLNNLKNLIA